MKKVVLASLLLCVASMALAQESQTAFNFLRLPVSAHVSALGGDNITIVEDDPTLIFHNPALITSVSDKSINVNWMTYMAGSNTASASFVRQWGERASWGVAAQYFDYGSMREVTASNEETGTFSARDVAVGGSFAYILSSRFAGGVTAKFVSSTIASYTALGVAVDLGLNYYDEDRGLSISAVARNLGGQVKAYDDDFEKIPFDLQVGITKRLGHSPLRFSATLTKLHDWDESFLKHVALGADVFLGKTIYIAGGYNFGRSKQMGIDDGDGSSSHGAGLSFGGGLQLERFKLHVAYAKYHVSASSLSVNVTYSL